MKHSCILIPVFNDRECLNSLLPGLAESLEQFADSRFSVLVVDDGSTEDMPIISPAKFSLQVLHLKRNIGHQKAISIGLAWIRENLPCDQVLVMDADGEDRPEDAALLVTDSHKNESKIIFAARASRQEGSRFRFFYFMYKILFRLLTGQNIAYGNFMLIPFPLLNKLVYYSEIWNHVAGGIMKSGLPFTSVITHRGKRLNGSSRMNFRELLIHGLGAISVFIEVIASRLLMFSLVLILLSVLAILVILGIRFFSDLAIPGWASTVVSAMLIVLLQSFLLSLFTIFLYLSSQSQRKFIPAQHYKDYTGEVEPLK